MGIATPVISRRRLMAAAAVALPLVGLARIIGDQDVTAADVAVTIKSFAFSPTPLTVPAGTRVVWTNMETGIPHTATSDTGVWDSGTLAPGMSFSFTFNTAGTFPYHCTIHPNMHGMVVVTAAGAAAPSAAAPSAAAPSAAAPTAAPTTAPPAAPRTGGGGEAQNYYIRRLGDG